MRASIELVHALNQLLHAIQLMRALNHLNDLMSNLIKLM
jgi:hypothetical protein